MLKVVAKRHGFRRRAAVLACTASFGAASFGAASFGAATFGALLSPSSAQAAPLGGAAEAGAWRSQAQSQPWAKAYAQRQWSAAIELIETIPEASRTAWHWLHLARALERSTQLVEAFAAYERVHDLAVDGAGVAGMRDIARRAKLESNALAHRIPWAEVSLTRPLPAGALVFVDQQWLEPARLRSPYPVNPGWHTFLVESNGEVLAARRAFFEEGQTRLVPLTISNGGAHTSNLSMPANTVADPAGMPAAAMPAATTGDANVHAGAARPSSLSWRPEVPRRASAEHDAGSLLKASYVSLGVGAISTLAGTGFLIAALNTRSKAADYTAACFNAACGPAVTADADRANRTWRARASAATASYAIGFAGFVTGGVLWLLHRDSSSRATTVNIADLSLELAPRFSPHGAMLRGTF